MIVDGNLPQGRTEDLMMQIPAFKEQGSADGRQVRPWNTFRGLAQR